MAGSSQNGIALSELRSDEEVELLDAVDDLRGLGFEGDLDLPQLVVCGDQSSGKSSVLEAISRVRFPSSDVLCTRFASELVLRKATKNKFSINILPAEHRPEEERKHLLGFAPEADLTSLDEFPMVVEAASNHLKCLGHQEFYEDKLRAELYGPNLPNLTLVDLPGLIHFSESTHGEQDIQTVRSVVEHYMSQKNSIILAVLAANNNFENQIVLQLARRVDAEGRRTVGIITKPDLAPPGSNTEALGIEWARNSHIDLEMGWHVLRNRDFESSTGTSSADERDGAEHRFFDSSSKHDWKLLPDQDLGASALRQKLSEILLRFIRHNLPSLLKDIRGRVAVCDRNSAQLGEPKLAETEQRQELTQISSNLHDLVRCGLHAQYQLPFFNPSARSDISARRIRSRLRSILDDFEAEIRTQGNQIHVDNNKAEPTWIDLSAITFNADRPQPPTHMSMLCLLKSVTTYVNENRGCELPSEHGSDAVPYIFRVMCSRWKHIALKYLELCFESACDFHSAALFSVSPKHISAKVWREIVEPYVEHSHVNMLAKLEEIYRPYSSAHPVTMRKGDYTYTVEQSQEAYKHTSTGGDTGLDPSSTQIVGKAFVYYNLALDTFAQNVATLVLENCIVHGIRSVFTPTTVAAMDGEMLAWLTAEPTFTKNQRMRNEKRLKALEGVLRIFNGHATRQGIRASGQDGIVTSPSEEQRSAQVPDESHANAAVVGCPTQRTQTLHIKDEARGAQGYPTPPKTPQSVVEEPTPTKGRTMRRKDPIKFRFDPTAT